MDDQKLAPMECEPQVMRIIAISTLAACAGVHISPQASTLPAQFVSVAPGELTPDDGFFVSTEGARAVLLQQRMHDLDMDERLTKSESGRKAADARAAKGEFCLRWCMPIGGGVVLVVEGVALGIFEALRH